MANTKSDTRTNQDASPVVFNASGLDGGEVELRTGYVEVLAADNDNHIYDMVRVHSSDRIWDVLVANDAVTGGTVYDCGFYALPVGSADPVVVAGKGDILFDGQSMASARTPLTSLFGAGTNGLAVEYIGKRVWEMLGLTADPDVEYVVGLLGATVGTAAGTIRLAVMLTDF